MKNPLLVVLGVALAIGSYLVGAWHRQVYPPKAAPQTRRILYYEDPMHPAYKSDRPGIAPDCGMKLEPVYAREEDAAAGMPPGALQVGADKQQLIGVKVGEVERASWSHTIRVPARVALDENRVFRVVGFTDGWVRQVGAFSAGDRVKKNDVLATFSSREFVSTEQAYFYALNTLDRNRQNSPENREQAASTDLQVQSAILSLQSLGMSDVQIKQIGVTRKSTQDVEIRAPVDGFVVTRGVFPGVRFDRGAELYRIADLSHVWILADTFDPDTRFFEPGRAVQVHYQNAMIPARISQALPSVSTETRARTIRLEADNPNLALTPGMFVNVELPVNLPPAVTVPAGAVVDAGKTSTVFIDCGKGYFEPRRVETGWRFDDRVEIVRGLEAGERIVVSGNFLIDSESRMKAAPRP